LPVATGDSDVDRQAAGVKAGVAIERVQVDDRGDDAPETPALVWSVDEDGQPGDETAAALNEIDRTGEHHLAAVAGAQRRLALFRVGVEVEADRLFVAFERACVGDDEAR